MMQVVGISYFSIMKDEKKIDDKVFLRFFRRLFFYTIYIGDRILMFWKSTETPGFLDWLDEDRRFTKVVKLKKTGFTQSYRKQSVIRVVTATIVYFLLTWIF